MHVIYTIILFVFEILTKTTLYKLYYNIKYLYLHILRSLLLFLCQFIRVKPNKLIVYLFYVNVCMNDTLLSIISTSPLALFDDDV